MRACVRVCVCVRACVFACVVFRVFPPFFVFQSTRNTKTIPVIREVSGGTVTAM